MVLLLTDVFLLLTQVLLWLVIGLITWFVLLKALPRAFLSLLVLLLILVVLASSFVWGAPADGGILDALWRIISFPFTPLGLALVLLLILLSGTKLSKVARNAIQIGLVILALGSVPIISYYLVQELEIEGIELIRAQPALTVPSSQRVIVLLGRGTTRPQVRPPRNAAPTSPPKTERPIRADAFQVLSRLPTQITERGDRIIYAAQLYQEEVRAGTRPLLVVSAPVRTDRKFKDGERKEEVSEATDIQTLLTQNLSVPTDATLLDYDGTSIHRSAEQVKQLLNDRKINYGNQITLVTTAMNMNRAALTFARVFDDTVINVRPTDFYTIPSASRLSVVVQGRDLVEREIQVTDFLPTAEAFWWSTQAIDEYLSALYYFLRGWIKPLDAPVVPPAATLAPGQAPYSTRAAPYQSSPSTSADAAPQPAVPAATGVPSYATGATPTQPSTSTAPAPTQSTPNSSTTGSNPSGKLW